MSTITTCDHCGADLTYQTPHLRVCSADTEGADYSFIQLPRKPLDFCGVGCMLAHYPKPTTRNEE